MQMESSFVLSLCTQVEAINKSSCHYGKQISEVRFREAPLQNPRSAHFPMLSFEKSLSIILCVIQSAEGARCCANHLLNLLPPLGSYQTSFPNLDSPQ